MDGITPKMLTDWLEHNGWGKAKRQRPSEIIWDKQYGDEVFHVDGPRHPD